MTVNCILTYYFQPGHEKSVFALFVFLIKNQLKLSCIFPTRKKNHKKQEKR